MESRLLALIPPLPPPPIPARSSASSAFRTLTDAEIGTELAAALRRAGVPKSRQQASDPWYLQTPLLPHQKEALRTLLDWENDTQHRGGILADEMGLGKTLTSLLLIAHNRQTHFQGNERQSTLIVAPANSIPVWQEQLHRYVNSHRQNLKMLTVHKVMGAVAPQKVDTSQFSNYDIILVTHNALAREAELLKEYEQEMEEKIVQGTGISAQVKLHLLDYPWYRVIMDECHRAGNSNTSLSKAAKAIKSTRFIGATGTPVRNTPMEILNYSQILGVPYWCVE